MRPIDADAIKYKYMLNHGGFAIAAEQKEINRMPTVDAVPVIRCKDCKFYEDHKRKIYENCTWNNHIVARAPDDFCSRAERKEE